MAAYNVPITTKTFTRTFEPVRVIFTRFATFKKIMFWWRGVWRTKV